MDTPPKENLVYAAPCKTPLSADSAGPASSHLQASEEISRSLPTRSLGTSVSQMIATSDDPQNNESVTSKRQSSLAAASPKADPDKAQAELRDPIPHLDQLPEVGVTSQNQLAENIVRRQKRSFGGGGLRRRVSSVLKMAGIHIEEDERDRMKGLWDVFDVDGDGIIDFAEFCRYTCDLIELQKKKKKQCAMSSIEAKFVRIVILEIMQVGTLPKAIESVFHMLDQNRSGKISIVEFEDGIRALGILDFNYEVHGHKRRFADTSLFLLKVSNPCRYWIVWLIEWKWFDRFILTCIIANSIMLGFRDYQDPGSVPDATGTINLNLRNQLLEGVEAIFSWIFVAECGLKIMAMGFLFGRGAYLRSYWNMLDFFVVVVGLISDLPGVPKISSLRTARVLRPLRTLSSLRRMRMLVYALLSALPALFNVMVILAFVFTVFGILGVLFWSGILYNRCRMTPAPVDGVWPLAGEGRVCGGAYTCPDGQFCGSVYSPPVGSYVNYDLLSSAEEWTYALVSFDNIGKAVLTLFQCITLEGWTSVMYNMQDAHNYAFATVYFFAFTIIGAFFLLQFVFAVIWERFNAANDGTAGEWDLILEERRASAARASQAEETPKDPDIELRREEFQRKSSYSQRKLLSIQTGIAVTMQTHPSDRLRGLCRRLVKDNRFSNTIVLCILLNTLVLAMDEYPVDQAREAVSEVINTGLTIIFSIEMILKLIGLGLRGYGRDRLNLFDGFIVCVSLAELMMKVFITSKKGSTGLSALRSFRLFRIMKLARSWRSLRELLQTIGNSLADVANFGLLLLLLMYVFSLIGMQFFANKFRFNDAGDPVPWEPHVYSNTTPPHAPWTPERPYIISRSNFDDSVAAFTTVFQCLSEENWVSVMYDGVRSSGWSATAYFLLVMIVGNIVILNLFLAILLGNFSLDEQIEETEVAIKRGEHHLQVVSQRPLKINAVLPIPPGNQSHPTTEHPTDRRVSERRRRRHHGPHGSEAERKIIERQSTGRSNDDFHVQTNTECESTKEQENKAPKAQQSSGEASSDSVNANGSECSVAERRVSGNPRRVRLNTMAGRRSNATSRVTSNTTADHVIVSSSDRSLFIFTKRNPIRAVCHRVMNHVYVEGLMQTIIMFSSVQLAIDNPLNDPNSKVSTVLSMMDNAFTAVFFIEMVMRVVSAGFLFNGKSSYLRDPWNVLDFSILVCSSTTLFSSNKTLRSLRSLRTLRAIRPLRMIRRIKGMRRLVNALLSCIPRIMNVFLVCSLIYLIFGIIGVNLFKGRMYYCDMSSLPTELVDAMESEFGFTKLSFRKLLSKQDCLDRGGVWRQSNRNYDNIVKSAMTLFEISTTEGWVAMMFQGVDATDIGYHPVQNWNRWYSAFFIVFVIIGNFFTLNLFVGAVIDNFNRMRDTQNALDTDNETQREWLQIQEVLRATRLIPKVMEPANRLRKMCYRVQQHPAFEAVIAASVFGNTLVLAMTHFQESVSMSSFLFIGNLFFWFVFFFEAVLKMMSLGSRYFNDRWNLFDFAVVCGSTVPTVWPFFTDGKISPIVNTLRAFRMGLAVRLMKRAKSMQDIINTILDNMPALVNVSTLLFLIMFVYAVIGVQLYAGVMLGDYLDEHANFRDVGVAMVTLFRFATGEAWNDVMYDLMVEPIQGAEPFPYGGSCVREYSYSDLQAARNYTGDPRLTIGCTPGIAVTYMYFLTYQLMATYVLLNLFVAVILEGFEETTEKNFSAVTKEDLTQVCGLWEKYDPSATGYVNDHDFLKFLREVPPPLGLSKHARRKDLERWARQLDLLIEPNGKISFNAFILSATQNLMHKVAADRGEYIVPARGAQSFFAKSHKAVQKVVRSRRGSASTVAPNLMVVISVKRIQAVVRTRMARKRFLELKKQMAAQRISLYDKAAQSNFKEPISVENHSETQFTKEHEPLGDHDQLPARIEEVDQEHDSNHDINITVDNEHHNGGHASQSSLSSTLSEDAAISSDVPTPPDLSQGSSLLKQQVTSTESGNKAS